MPNVKKIKTLLSLGIVGLVASDAAFSQGAPSSEIEQIISDQRARQISRQISDSISRRVTSDLDSTFAGPQTKENKKGASADGNALMPDSVWSAFSWSRISDDANFGGSFDVDIYQSTTGIDYNVGNFYFGGTLTYAGTTAETEFGAFRTDGSTHSVGVTPYAAYVINKNLFLSAMSGYTYSNNNTRDNFNGNIPESESDAYQTEVDLNGLHVIDQWFMKGKIGTRYQHGHTKTDAIMFGGAQLLPASRSNADSWTYLVDSEIGYAFKNGLKAFTGVLFEYNNPSHDLGLADGVFYYSAGVDYVVNNKLSLGTKVQTDLTNEDIDLTTVALTARLALD